MTGGFRQRMSWLHTWTGLWFGTVLYFIFLTGTAGYFDTEIDRWMRPEWPVAERIQAPQAAQMAGDYLGRHASEAGGWFISLPGERSTPYLRVAWRSPTETRIEQLDPASGEPFVGRETGGGQFLYRMHWKLHYLPALMGEWIVGIATLFMLIALITGVIVHKKIFSEFFTFRPGKGQRSWLDAHNVMGVAALPFHLMITYSGLIFLLATYMPLMIAAHYGGGSVATYYSGEAPGLRSFFAEQQGREAMPGRENVPAPLAALGPMIQQAEQRWGKWQVSGVEVLHPGDAAARVVVRQQLEGGPLRSGETLTFDGVSGALVGMTPAVGFAAKAVHDVFLGLHEGLFAGPVLRWLYFLSGLLGAGMIASGLVLWATKRRQRIEKSQGQASLGLRLVERLNVGTILGLPIAIAVYFWANRLMPAAFAQRAEWEVHAMFIAWGVLLLHAMLRPVAQAWVEQGWLAAAAFLLLPVLNALTTNRHLATSVSQGDWALAGVDLTLLVLGGCFAFLAVRMTRRLHAATPVKRPGAKAARGGGA